MMRFLKSKLSLIAMVGVLAPLSQIRAASCLENRDFYQSLPAEIGREDQTGKVPFALNCDTVFVRKGVTTTINPGSMLYFKKPSLNSVIKVEGTLLVKGSKNSYVTFSGSLDTAKGKTEPGNKQWGGIEIAEGGKLVMEFAGMLRAPTPITTFSRDVKITNCFFKGSSGVILPDGTLYPMETNWQTINELDLAKAGAEKKNPHADKPTDSLTEKEKNELLGKNDSGFWTWKKAAGGAAALAAIGVGAVFLMPEKSGAPSVVNKPPPNSTPKNPIDPLPPTPGNP